MICGILSVGRYSLRRGNFPLTTRKSLVGVVVPSKPKSRLSSVSICSVDRSALEQSYDMSSDSTSSTNSFSTFHQSRSRNDMDPKYLLVIYMISYSPNIGVCTGHQQKASKSSTPQRHRGFTGFAPGARTPCPNIHSSLSPTFSFHQHRPVRPVPLVRHVS
jgi:hypothetical protein